MVEDPRGRAPDETRYEFKHLPLNGHGARHDFKTVAALTKHLSAATNKMQAVAADPARIHCPKCKVWMLRVKEPDPWSTNQYLPFLSYDGMVISRGARNVSCDGILSADPRSGPWG
ncbi:hypothetical protein OKW34_001410 [Paraburkholderia youngii]|uniref:hypothetical protein n=1 Tax=Paraburkholderia youngii TaxID=2782701 RepID=UPI00158FF101|nr:hypothetical protein [Paraburkholderia youngii]NUX53152.1 hypothetical protein [Paraburkholderia youngii]